MPASSMCSIIPATYISPFLSLIISTSISLAFSRYSSIKITLFEETSRASLENDSKLSLSYAICIALPPSTYEGLTKTGYPISSAFSKV